MSENVSGSRVFLRSTQTKRFLFLKRPEGGYSPCLWVPPGGKLNAGESPLEAALRETREETGIDCIHTQYIGEATIDYCKPSASTLRVQNAFYLSEVSGEPYVDGAAWMTLENYLQLPTPSGLHDFVLKHREAFGYE
jgi:8-oxo-dGTP diphosphatase